MSQSTPTMPRALAALFGVAALAATDAHAFDTPDSLLDLPFDSSLDSSEEPSNAQSFIIVGDMNGDGSLTNGDISAFTMALTNPDLYGSTYPGLDADFMGDFNGDDLLTNGDIAGFVNSLTTGEQILRVVDERITLVPSPTAFGAGLAAAGLLIARRRRRSA